MSQNGRKLEHKIIADWITSEASVLDLGCGDGELLSHTCKGQKRSCTRH